MSREEVVLRLFGDGSDEVKTLGGGPRLGDLLRRPLAGTPIEGPPLIDHKVHRPHRLLDGCGRVRAMAIQDIDVLHIQALERSFGAFDDVLPGEAPVVGAWAAPEELGGDDEVGALPTELTEGLAHDLLSAAIGVDLSVVEEVDAMVAAALEEGLGLLHVQLVAEAHPRTVGELAHLETRPAEVVVLHLSPAKGAFSGGCRRRGVFRWSPETTVGDRRQLGRRVRRIW